ncbi:MAG: alpha-ketoacid dehydrogenase subunit beta [Victivallales bacterium]|nr:alpha-ketoacid dehydrogenase subunit beta [Victivallales bacterium]
MPELYYSKAVNEALDEELARDKNVILMGEDIGIYGGAFGATRGLFEKFGAERLWETPISENSFTGLAVGAAMMGLRPVVEIMFMDFIALALDQLLNSAGKLHYMYGGQVNVPLVMRTPGGAKGGYGPSHSQMLSNLLVGVPGIKVVAPSNAMQVKGILKAAIRDDNPVVVIENKRLYPQKGIVPDGDYTLPLDKAVVFSSKLAPTLTLASYSSMTPVCLAVQQAFEKAGIGIEVVDLVSLQPLDTATVFASLRKTGRIVIAEEACLTGGVGAELSALIAEHCLDALEAPIARVAAKDLPIPSSLAMEKMILPQPDDVVKAVKKTLDY